MFYFCLFAKIATVKNPLQKYQIQIMIRIQGQQYATAHGFSRCTGEFSFYRGICCLLQKNAELPVLCTLTSNLKFLGYFLIVSFINQLKSSHCKQWFCALGPSSEFGGISQITPRNLATFATEKWGPCSFNLQHHFKKSLTVQHVPADHRRELARSVICPLDK